MRAKKLLIPALSLLILAPGAALAGFRAAPVAEPKAEGVSFGLSGGLTLLGGEANEHVFAPGYASAEYAAELGLPDDGRRHQLSRLDWDMESVTFVGLSGSARLGRWSLNGGVWYGASLVDDADMDDYDWQNGDHVGWSDYSRSDSELTDAWMIDANLSYDFWSGETLTAYVFGGVRSQHWKWTADGLTDFYYEEYDHRHMQAREHVCDYMQKYLFGYIGLGGTWRISDKWRLAAYASWAPAYRGKDRDNHIGADKYVTATFDYDEGNVYAAGLELDWKVLQNGTIFFALDWQKTKLHEGDLTQLDLDSGEIETLGNGAGIENEYIATSAGFRWAF